MADAIIIGLLLVAVVLALLRAKRHFRGGGCCGGGGRTIRERKTLSGPVLGQKVVCIQGMHCENCAIRVENALNRLDGVLAKAELPRKRAVVSYSQEVPDETLKATVEALGYQVTDIHQKGA